MVSQFVKRRDGRVYLKVRRRSGVCLAWLWGKDAVFTRTVCGVDDARADSTTDAPTCLVCMDTYETCGAPETPVQTDARFEHKDQVFAELQKTGEWPSRTCPKCKHGCCKRTWHHIGECCLHCGNDERKH